MKLSTGARHSISYTLIGALPFLSALVLLPFYSNQLSTADFGLLNVYISLALLAQVITTLGVDQYIPVLISTTISDPERRKTLLSHAFGFQLVYGILATVVLCFLGSALMQWMYGSEASSFWPYGVLSIVTGFFNGYFRTQTTVFSFEERVRIYGGFNLFNFVLTIVLSLWFLNLYGPTIMGPIMGRLISGVAIFILSVVYQMKHSTPRAVGEGLKEVTTISMVMFFYSLVMWVLNYVDRFVITANCSLEDVAVYDFCMKCLSPLEFLQMGLSGFLLPRMYTSFSGNYERPEMSRANTLLHGFTVASVISLLGVMLVIPIIGPWFIRNEALFASFDLMGLVGIGFLTKTLFLPFMGVLMLRKEAGRVVRALTISAAIQVVALGAFTGPWGILGAVVAILIGKVFSVLLLRLEMGNRIVLRINLYKTLVYPSIISLLLVGLYILRETITLLGGVSIALGISILISWFFFRKDLGKAKEVIFGKSA
jgi:O-antigen/teichoic acid export membrane protein